MTPEMAELIAAGVTTDVLRVQAHKDGMVSMLQDGIEKAGRGVTTLEEMLRIAVLENIADMPAAPPPDEKPETKAAQESLPAAATVASLSLDLDSYRKEMTDWLTQKKR
ncbi:MAG: hypothetical protein PHW60_15335 [Kiritimatiellae bacterium]|nr:hypothetical protein [Kiritimatiellia bacterium]